MSTITEKEDGKVFRIQVNNAWADIALFGSTVIGWHPSSSTSKDYSAIFLSKDTKPGKAFRGGIPIVFPVFGEVKDHGDVPEQIKNCTRHGFCRDRNWKLENKQSEKEDKASVTMSLSSDDEPSLLEKFPCPFKICHTVTLTKDTLETTLKIARQSMLNKQMAQDDVNIEQKQVADTLVRLPVDVNTSTEETKNE